MSADEPAEASWARDLAARSRASFVARHRTEPVVAADHDPEVAARMIAALAEAAEYGEALARVRHILSSGYGCLRCAEADLRAAVGLPPSSEPHEHP